MTMVARLLLFLIVAITSFSGGVGAQELTAEDELAQTYAPIAFLKEQASDCDTNGEPYLPVPVEIVFNDPEVLLKRHAVGDELRDPVVTAAPNAQDLAGKDKTHYLDLPGNPRLPGCDYEQWSRSRMDELGLKPSVYARIETEIGRPGKLVLQYWFYWAFDDFNNTHESDWEMIQLVFDADSAEEALSRKPSEVVFAQHGGGERADWDDQKVQKDGKHIYVFPAAGSHATYYGDAIWIGWGAGGTGFGCDIADAPLLETPLEVILLPNDPDPDGPFGWLLFEGRWGERQAWEFNGPVSPNVGLKWKTPLSWTDDVRVSSLAISGHETIGPGPASLFCSISSFAGSTATNMAINPFLIGYQSVAVVLGLILLTGWNWYYILHALRLFFSNINVYLPLSLSLSLLPVAFAGARIQELAGFTKLGDWISVVFGSDNTSVVLGLGFGSFQQFLLMALVAPAIIRASFEIQSGKGASLRRSWSFSLQKSPTTIRALLLNTFLLTLMVLTVVLIPLAVYRAVQWLYTPHAVVISGADVRNSRHVSRARTRGRWWRTLAMSALIWLMAGAPGPIIGGLLMLIGIVSIDGAQVVSSFIYAFAFAITVIASTLYYQRLGDAVPEDSKVVPATPQHLSVATT